jgi:hypothetical protein
MAAPLVYSVTPRPARFKHGHRRASDERGSNHIEDGAAPASWTVRLRLHQRGAPAGPAGTSHPHLQGFRSLFIQPLVLVQAGSIRNPPQWAWYSAGSSPDTSRRVFQAWAGTWRRQIRPQNLCPIHSVSVTDTYRQCYDGKRIWTRRDGSRTTPAGSHKATAPYAFWVGKLAGLLSRLFEAWARALGTPRGLLSSILSSLAPCIPVLVLQPAASSLFWVPLGDYVCGHFLFSGISICGTNCYGLFLCGAPHEGQIRTRPSVPPKV